MSAETFKQGRAMSDADDLPTSDLPGFAGQAYTKVLKSGSHVTNTVVTLKDTVQLLVRGRGATGR